MERPYYTLKALEKKKMRSLIIVFQKEMYHCFVSPSKCYRDLSVLIKTDIS